MVLLGEQERLLASESSFINATGANLRETDYGTLTVPTGGAILVFRCIVNMSVSGTATVNLYLAMGGATYWVVPSLSTSGDNELTGYIYLAAGTYANVTFHLNSSADFALTSIKAGLALFNDLTYSAYASRSPETNFATTAPAARATPIGATAKSTVIVQVFANSASADATLNNVGDTDATGLKILVDSAQVDWTQRYHPSGGVGVSGYLVLVVNAGSSHNIQLARQDTGYTFSDIYASIINCPWLLTDTVGFPVQSLSLTQESTIYVTAEPLFSDPATKAVYAGKVRCCSFGAAADYYSSEVGTGILIFSYKFDSVDVSTVGVVAALGFGGCISYVGADLV
jgi:hypothetical protein